MQYHIMFCDWSYSAYWTPEDHQPGSNTNCATMLTMCPSGDLGLYQTDWTSAFLAMNGDWMSLSRLTQTQVTPEGPVRHRPSTNYSKLLPFVCRSAEFIHEADFMAYNKLSPAYAVSQPAILPGYCYPHRIDSAPTLPTIWTPQLMVGAELSGNVGPFKLNVAQSRHRFFETTSCYELRTK